MKHGFVQTMSHGRVHYLESGEGPALVLLHSNGASAFQYEQVLPGFAKQWRTIAMDMPGHGDSDPISKHYSIEMYDEAVGKELVSVLPDCGHFPMIDDPELFIKEVNRLLAAAAAK